MIPELLVLRRTATAEHTDTVWHSHVSMQLGYVLVGKVVVHFPRVSYEIRPFDLYLVARGHLHRIETFAGGKEYHGFVSLTSEPEHFSSAAGEMAGLGWLRNRSVIVRQADGMRARWEEIESCWGRGDPSGRLVSHCLLLRLFVELADAHPIVVEAAPAAGTSLQEHRIFQRAIRIIEGAYTRPGLSVDDVARSCRTSRSYLDKLFHRAMGFGPKRFIQRYRIDRAKELLRAGEYSKSAIAEQTGFRDVFSFSRVFKRLTGKPPSAY